MWSVRRNFILKVKKTFFSLFSVLQLTAISTNIKERLDFSCAVFGPDGGLVANAPHIPVHLGAMQEAVQYQVK
jgi:5-oxoprolinase (ATP-hydrolysing)